LEKGLFPIRRRENVKRRGKTEVLMVNIEIGERRLAEAER